MQILLNLMNMVLCNNYVRGRCIGSHRNILHGFVQSIPKIEVRRFWITIPQLMVQCKLWWNVAFFSDDGYNFAFTLLQADGLGEFHKKLIWCTLKKCFGKNHNQTVASFGNHLHNGIIFQNASHQVTALAKLVLLCCNAQPERWRERNGPGTKHNSSGQTAQHGTARNENKLKQHQTETWK